MAISTRSIFASILFTLSINIQAEVSLSGYFIARSICPAYQSFKNQTNPGLVMLKPNYVYDLIAKNDSKGSHFLISTDAEPALRWVHMACGEHVIPAPENSLQAQYVLAVSWQPAFCENNSNKIECQNPDKDAFEASHFTLHGLWPQPKNNIYCDVAAELSNKKWHELPTLELDKHTRAQLKKMMPGYASHLHRYEWLKHGTCYQNRTAQQYYADSIRLLEQLNQSELRQLFANQIKQEISAEQIKQALNQSFGPEAGKKIFIGCDNDGQRTLIEELVINLGGDLNQLSLIDAIALGEIRHHQGCRKGIVDPVGNQ